MKKLMIALLAVISVVSVKAATVDWRYEINGQAGGSATEFTGYTVYMVDATYFEGLAKVTADSITSEGNYLLSKTIAQTGATGKGSNKKYQFSAQGQITNDDLVEGKTYNYYLVLVDKVGENYQATAYDYVARDPTSSPAESSYTLSFASTAISMTGFAPAGGDVPEPTSGLLLLVGGAMLALRRKQK